MMYSDPREFHLVPKNVTLNNIQGCKHNLSDILDSIASYYDATKGWELNPDIPTDDIFTKYQMAVLSDW